MAWGRATGTWWALCTWTQRVVIDGRSQAELPVAAWLPSASVRKPLNAAEVTVPRLLLADDQRDWPAPNGWPGWYAGPWLSGALLLPVGLAADNRPEWERRRDRGERPERKRRR